MTRAVIYQESTGSIRSVDTDNVNSRILSSERRTVAQGEREKLSRIKTSNYPISRIINDEVNSKIKEILPFRVRFINIGIEAYGPENPPPVGVAIIGFNNYIL